MKNIAIKKAIAIKYGFFDGGTLNNTI